MALSRVASWHGSAWLRFPEEDCLFSRTAASEPGPRVSAEFPPWEQRRARSASPRCTGGSDLRLEGRLQSVPNMWDMVFLGGADLLGSPDPATPTA